MYTLNQYIWVEPQKLPETFLLYLGGRGDTTLFVLAMHHSYRGWTPFSISLILECGCTSAACL